MLSVFLPPLIFASWFNVLRSVLKGNGRKKELAGTWQVFGMEKREVRKVITK
jgi:hypothetical protein